MAGDELDRAARRPVRTAAITNLGCKVNQAEMEGAARRLREQGIAIVDGDRRADLVLVNTCTVTAEADATSRNAVRRARRASPGAPLVVTGCSVQIGRASLQAADPAARLVDNRAKDALLAEIEQLVGSPGGPGPDAPGAGDAGSDGAASGDPGATMADGRLHRALPTLSGVAIEGIHDDRASVERTRAFIKVQDGCSFFCTYCIIPAARGAERSVAPSTVLADVRRALEAGHREIVLTGINLGTYDGGRSERGYRGSHRGSALTLAGLIRRILDETAVERVRLSSIEPQHVDDDLLRAWVDGAPRTMPHLHLPLQSGDDGVLRRMGRRYTTAEYAAVVARARAAIPGVAIHGDVMVGFPTEDDAAWEQSLAFIRGMDFAGIHVFRYSGRPGTAATRMAGQVAEAAKKTRAAALLAVSADARERWAAGRIGGVADVLFESRLHDGRWTGHARDHTLIAAAAVDARPLGNVIGRVRLDAVDPARRDRLAGRMLSVSRPNAPLVPLGTPPAPSVDSPPAAPSPSSARPGALAHAR